MTATLQSVGTIKRYAFNIELEGKSYNAVIFVDEKGRFADDEIRHCSNENELDFEGEEGDIRDQILEYLDENWETLTKEKQ